MGKGRRYSKSVLALGMLFLALFATTDVYADNGLDYFNNPPGSEWAVLYGANNCAYSIKMGLDHYIVAGTQWDAASGPPFSDAYEF